VVIVTVVLKEPPTMAFQVEPPAEAVTAGALV
jgi:hypothetical protein